MTALPALILRADALHLPLPDESVDLIVTSPPYFALRSYRDGDEHYEGQLGSEPTPQAFLEALWAVMHECWRVLKPSGSVFVNLGDKRSGSGGPNGNGGLTGKVVSKLGANDRYATARATAPTLYTRSAFGRPKSKMLLPHRFAIGCEDGLADPEGKGWVVRQDIVWQKKNGLPESVQDRCRDSHEYLFHLVKSGRYFASIDEIREPGSWTGTSGSCSRCGRRMDAGNGSGASRPRVTGASAATTAWPSLIGSPTSSLWDPSPMGSSSITSAGTEDASGQATLSRSLAGRTLPEATPSPQPTSPRPSAATVTPTTRPTPTGRQTEAVCAECACELATERGIGRHDQTDYRHERDHGARHALGSLPGSVWALPSEPLIISDEVKAHYGLPDHFAAFPTELVRRIILGWSPSGICVECGEGRRPVVAKTFVKTRGNAHRSERDLLEANDSTGGNLTHSLGAYGRYDVEPIGYSCRCGRHEPVLRRAVVLDIFGGTGTTAGVARALGRIGVSVDLSHDYSRLADYLIHRSGRFAKVVNRTHRENQGDLFGVPA